MREWTFSAVMCLVFGALVLGMLHVTLENDRRACRERMIGVLDRDEMAEVCR